jgi:hypothetical protein
LWVGLTHSRQVGAAIREWRLSGQGQRLFWPNTGH